MNRCRVSSRASVALVITFAACASSKATINSFVDPTYERDAITSIALFPIRNAQFAPSEARQINRQISMGINSKNPNLTIINSSQAIDMLNEHGLADDWALFLDNYVVSGVPDANVLGMIGDALSTDAVIQGEIVNVYQEDGEAYVSRGQTRVTVRFTILDCQNGRLIWEATSDGIRTGATTLSKAPPVIVAVQLAVNKLLENIPL